MRSPLGCHLEDVGSSSAIGPSERPLEAAGLSRYGPFSGLRPSGSARRGSIRAWSTRTIATDLTDRILTITLDRPDRLNAFTVPMQRELCDVLDEVDADPEVRVVVVTGRGRGFCAGADLGVGRRLLRRRAPAARPPGRSGRRARTATRAASLTLRLYECTKPVIAADQRTRGRCRRHHDPADGHPLGQRDRPLRVRVRAARASCPRRARRGSCPGSSASTPRWSGR